MSQNKSLQSIVSMLGVEIFHTGMINSVKNIVVNIKVFENFTFSSGFNFNSKKSIIWFIMRSPAKFQPPNPSIKASNCISRFWSFDRFVWKLGLIPRNSRSTDFSLQNRERNF
jgi:hypothetical protein